MTTKEPITLTIMLDPADFTDPAEAHTLIYNHTMWLMSALFETCGEDNRRPDGTRVLDCHGHHVAQGLAATVEARWRQHETTPKGERDE